MHTDEDLKRLQSVRARLELVLEDEETAPRDLAGVSREYRLVLDAIRARSDGPAGSAVDEISARRAKRGSA